MPQSPPSPPLGFFDRFRSIPDYMREAIYERLERGETPLEIHRWLTDTYRRAADVPSLRTVERAKDAYKAADNGSAAWSVVTASDAAEARLGLRVLAAVVGATEGRRLEVSQRAMQAAVAVLRARDDLDPWQAYLIGRAYLSRPAQNRPTYDLDLWLAGADLYKRVTQDVSSFADWPPRRRAGDKTEAVDEKRPPRSESAAERRARRRARTRPRVTALNSRTGPHGRPSQEEEETPNDKA